MSDHTPALFNVFEDWNEESVVLHISFYSIRTQTADSQVPSLVSRCVYRPKCDISQSVSQSLMGLDGQTVRMTCTFFSERVINVWKYLPYDIVFLIV